MKKLLFLILACCFVASPIVASQMVHRQKKKDKKKGTKKRKSKKKRSNSALYERESDSWGNKWLEKQLSKKHRNARLAFRNDWPIVVKNTVLKLEAHSESEEAHNGAQIQRKYYRHFIKEMLPQAKRELKAQNPDELLTLLEENKIDCTADNMREKAVELLAQGIFNKYNDAYDEWAVKFEKDVEELRREYYEGKDIGYFEESVLESEDIGWGEGIKKAFNTIKLGLGSLIASTQDEIAKNRSITELKKDAFEKAIIMRRKYQGCNIFQACTANLLATVDGLTSNIISIPSIIGFPWKYYRPLTNAYMDLEGLSVSPIVTGISMCIAGILSYSLVQSGLVVAAFQAVNAMTKFASPYLLQLTGALLLPPAAGAAAYFLASYFFGFGAGGTAIIGIVVLLLLVLLEIAYLKYTDEMRYDILKRKAKKLFYPLLLISYPILPPVVGYMVFNYEYYKAGDISIFSSVKAFMSFIITFLAMDWAVMPKNEEKESLWSQVKKAVKINFIKEESEKTQQYTTRTTFITAILIIVIFLLRGGSRFERIEALFSDIPPIANDHEMRELARRHSTLLKDINHSDQEDNYGSNINDEIKDTELDDEHFNEYTPIDDTEDDIPIQRKKKGFSLMDSRTSFTKEDIENNVDVGDF